MRLFEKRPLSLILCIILGGFSLFIESDLPIALSVVGICAALIISIALFFKVKRRTKIFYILCLFSFSVSVLLSLLWQSSFFPVDYYNKTVEVNGYVTHSEHTDASPLIHLKVDEMGGSDADFKILVYGTREQLSGINQGDSVSLEIKISELKKNGFDEFDSRSYLVSQGISATAVITEECTVKIISHSGFDLFSIFSEARTFISGRLKLLTNEKNGSLLSALITGDRTMLDGNTVLNFKRIGISHILALSGLHLAILTALLLKLFKLLRVNKRISLLLSSVFSLFYMALAGFSPSITRAGIMLILSTLLFLIAGSRDGVTSLFVSVALIVAINPCSVFDISLWLSAFATLGVLFYVEIKEPYKRSHPLYKRFLIKLRDGILISVFAITSTFAVTLFSFGEFSIISVVSTLLFSLPIEILIYLSLLVLIFGNIIPFGKLAVALSNLLLKATERFASADWVFVSVNEPVLKAMMLFAVVFFFCYMLLGRKHKKKIGVIVLCVIFLSVNLTVLVNSMKNNRTNSVTYTASDASDVLTVKSNGTSALICSGISAESHILATDILKHYDIVYLDKLILPSYSDNDCEFVNKVVSSIKTDTLYLPMPMSEYEIIIAERISNLLSQFGTKLDFYEAGYEIAIGNAGYTLHCKQTLSEEDYYPQNMFSVAYGDEVITYVSAGLCDSGRQDVLMQFSATDTLIVGANGYYKPNRFYIQLSNLERIIFGEKLEMTVNCEEFYKETGASCIYAESSVTINYD